MKERGRSAGSGTFSLSATARDDDHGRLVARVGAVRLQQRVERRDAQADEVRRRREVRLVGDAAARVEAHGPRVQPGAQVGREVAGLAVVAGDDERRPAGRRGVVDAVEQRRDEVGRMRLRDERAARPRAPAGRRRASRRGG